MNIDTVSMARLSKLHPALRAEASCLYVTACSNLTGRASVRVTQGLRTFAEQDDLYYQRPRVTNAKGGQSLHNYGLALDFCLLLDGKLVSWDAGRDFDGDKIADWMEVVKTFKAAGWTWGGEFKSIVDRPHLEKAFGQTWQQLLYKHNLGKVDEDGYVML